MLKTFLRLAAVLSLALAAQSASAQLINLNFIGSAGTAYSGTTETSPFTPLGPAGTWNNITLANLEEDVAVLDSTGAAYGTLVFDSTSNVNSNWSGTSLLDGSINYTTAGGVYDVANLYENGFINGGNNTTGFRLQGLAAGTYEIAVVPFFRGGDAAGVTAQTAVLSIGLGNTTDTRGVGDATLTSTAASPTQNVDTTFTTWVASTDGSTAYNYIGGTVVIDDPNRWLTILLQDASDPDRPGLATVQINLIPEPSTFALIGCGVGLLVLRRRRHLK